MTDRPTKITFGEMGEMGVRGIQPRRAYRAANWCYVS
jgi:hypothetical protein